jgi:Apea-like HEPN
VSLLGELFDLVSANHPGLPGDAGFALLANVAALDGIESQELLPGIVVRRAEPNEIETLRTMLELYRPGPPLSHARNPYETEVEITETGPPHGRSYVTKDLPKELWQYHVIAYTGSRAEETARDLVTATLLTDSHLVLGPAVGTEHWESGFGRSLAGCGPAFARLWDELCVSDEALLHPRAEELQEAAEVYERLDRFSDERTDLHAVLRGLEQLDFLPAHSPLLFLGYISVLESLITHRPDPKDAYDSLSRQVRQKMLLIGRRSRLLIPYELFDENVPANTLWTKLYDYRSRVAHGAVSDFQGQLQALRNPETALEFVRRATVAVARQVLEEPELLADLREC